MAALRTRMRRRTTAANQDSQKDLGDFVCARGQNNKERIAGAMNFEHKRAPSVYALNFGNSKRNSDGFKAFGFFLFSANNKLINGKLKVRFTTLLEMTEDCPSPVLVSF